MLLQGSRVTRVGGGFSEQQPRPSSIHHFLVWPGWAIPWSWRGWRCPTVVPQVERRALSAKDTHSVSHTLTHTYTLMHTHIYTHTHIHTLIHSHTFIYTHTHSHTHTHTLTHTFIYTLIHTHSHTHSHTLTLTLTHTCCPRARVLPPVPVTLPPPAWVPGCWAP